MEELIGEDELLSEEALYVQGYKEPTPKTASEQETEERFQNHRADVLEQDRVHSLEALIWWLAEGGVFPNSYGIPNKAGLTKMGGSGFERALDRLDAGGNGESIFQDGWADYAKKQYRLVVFSKVSRKCVLSAKDGWADEVDLLPLFKEGKEDIRRISSDSCSIHRRARSEMCVFFYLSPHTRN